MKLSVLAPGKVNLCLFLGPARADGRHELVTLFESVSLADHLIVDTDADRDAVICPGVPEPNLVSSAIAGLRDRGWDAQPVRIEIEKRIPVAAGMGGGSADAAAALRIAAELAPGRPEEVASLAASLGADVPSQLVPGLVLGTGAGDLVESYEPLAPHAFVIVPQPVALSTPDVYREADRLGLPRSSVELESRYAELVTLLQPNTRPPAGYLINDLGSAAESLCPPIADALKALQDPGEAAADIAMVCGSGPTVAGLFWGSDSSERALAAATSLGERFPGAVAAVPVGTEFGSPRVI